jgi:acetoin utilization protein AcuB
MDGTIKVRELMTEDVIGIVPELKVDIALRLMADSNIRRLPVISKTGRLVGMLTLDQAHNAMPRQSKDPLAPLLDEDPPIIRDIMTDYVYTVGPDDNIARAATIMLNHKIGGIPVLEDKKVVGIITESDIFRFVAARFADVV